MIKETYDMCAPDNSPVYLIEKYFKEPRSGENLKLFDKQKEMCNVLSKENNLVIKKTRQVGVTTTCAAFFACEMALEPVNIVIIGNRLELAGQMLDKIKKFLLQLPNDFWNGNEVFKTCNFRDIELTNGSTATIRSTASGLVGLNNIDYLVFDEAAFIENGDKIFDAAYLRLGKNAHTVLISTPNGKDKLFYKKYSDGNFMNFDFSWYHDPRKDIEWYKNMVQQYSNVGLLVSELNADFYDGE